MRRGESGKPLSVSTAREYRQRCCQASPAPKGHALAPPNNTPLRGYKSSTSYGTYGLQKLLQTHLKPDGTTQMVEAQFCRRARHGTCPSRSTGRHGPCTAQADKGTACSKSRCAYACATARPIGTNRRRATRRSLPRGAPAAAAKTTSSWKAGSQCQWRYQRARPQRQLSTRTSHQHYPPVQWRYPVCAHPAIHRDEQPSKTCTEERPTHQRCIRTKPIPK